MKRRCLVGLVSFVAMMGAGMGACSSPAETGGGGSGTGGSTAAAPACDDGVKNGAESDVDCGGDCPVKCGVGAPCAEASDCGTGVCKGGLCIEASCSDGVQNGAETGTDCGGNCPGCEPGQPCSADVDCTSQVCEGGKCAAPSCSDEVTNGTETDLNCGGADCSPCGPGKHCGGPADCASKVCNDSGLCAAPTCSDSVQNGNETGVDCGGGGSPACPKCDDGQPCDGPADCQSGVCQSKLCVPASCGDLLQNGDETDVDCGGSCAGCGIGQHCGDGTDCNALACDDASQKCRIAHSCKELKAQQPMLQDGIYTVDFNLPGTQATVYCDMTTDGGGWTALLNPDMPGLPEKVDALTTSVQILAGVNDCGPAGPVVSKVANGWHSLEAYECGNTTISWALQWVNTIGATDVMFLSSLGGLDTHTITVNGHDIAPDANDGVAPPGGPYCFFWNAGGASANPGPGCPTTYLMAPPHFYDGKVDGNLAMQIASGPACKPSCQHGTGANIQKLFVR